jgi:hypothetical protein
MPPRPPHPAMIAGKARDGRFRFALEARVV